MEIEELKPGQEVLIIDKENAWPVKIDYVDTDQHIHVRSLVSGSFFVYTRPEDIVRIEPMEGKEVLNSMICVKCLEKQILVPITDCATCYRFCGKTVGDGCRIKIICKDTNGLDNNNKKL